MRYRWHAEGNGRPHGCAVGIALCHCPHGTSWVAREFWLAPETLAALLPFARIARIACSAPNLTSLRAPYIVPPKPETLRQPPFRSTTVLPPAVPVFSHAVAATMTSPAAAPLAHGTKSSRKTIPALSGLTKSDAAAKPSNAPVKSTDAGELHSGDESSELSESSEEPSDLSSSDDDDEESTDMAVDAPKEPEVVNLRANRGNKPTYKLDQEELGPDIRTFLKDFLPKLKAANEELEADRKQGTLKKREIDAVDEEESEQYIEMVRNRLSFAIVSIY